MNKLKLKALKDARILLRSQEKALLSTHSVAKEGYPFGSVTTYMTDARGHPIIYISHLAQHTRNIKQDPKISLLVSADNEHDINAGARLTILGTAQLVDTDAEPELAEQFYLQFPESRAYQNTHDFNFYRVHTEHVRYIGGFGQIHWLSTEHFILPEPNWLARVQPAIEHMNEDHADAMVLMLKHFKNITTNQVQLTHLLPDGCRIKINNLENHFLPYESPIETAADIRGRLVALTQRARSEVN
jgi:putative heme iron utilization protein